MTTKQSIELTTEAVANALLDAKLDKIVAGFLDRSDSPYDDQINSLKSQLADENLPKSVREHISGAIEALREAQARANEPRLRRIALAVISVLNEHRIPLQLKNGQEPEKPKAGRGRASKQEHERQLLDLATRRGPDGFTTTEAARVLDVSIATARKVCLRLMSQNKLRHNGLPKQQSRYLIA